MVPEGFHALVFCFCSICIITGFFIWTFSSGLRTVIPLNPSCCCLLAKCSLLPTSSRLWAKAVIRVSAPAFVWNDSHCPSLPYIFDQGCVRSIQPYAAEVYAGSGCFEPLPLRSGTPAAPCSCMGLGCKDGSGRCDSCTPGNKQYSRPVCLSNT